MSIPSANLFKRFTDGFLVPFSSLLISAWLIPVRSASSFCVRFCDVLAFTIALITSSSIDQTRKALYYEPDYLDEILEEHRAILTAIKNRDVEEGKTAMSRHLECWFPAPSSRPDAPYKTPSGRTDPADSDRDVEEGKTAMSRHLDGSKRRAEFIYNVK